jgi:hypothetical protein
MKLFSSYLSAGLLLTAITALLFAKVNFWAFPVLGLVSGIVNRSVIRCIAGLVASSGICLLIVALVPVATSPPSPPGLLHFAAFYTLALWGASTGAALLLPHRQLLITAIVSTTISLLILIGCTSVLRHIFPEELRVLEMWEYMALLLAAPVLAVGTWWPVELVDKSL